MIPLSQKNRILAQMITNGGTLSSYDIDQMQPRIKRYSARIEELRKEGYEIVTSQDKIDRAKFYFTYRPKEMVGL